MTLDWELVARVWLDFVRAAGMTLVVSLAATAIGLTLGLLTAVARLSPWWPLRAVARAYVEVVRGTPLLVQLFFVYAALPLWGLRLPAIAAGILALALYTGAFAAEIFRAGITSVHRGQVEAARSLGMSYGQALRRIVAPIMAALVLPPLTSEFTGVIKWSSLLSLITVPELTYAAQRVIGETYSVVEPLLISGVCYWALNDLMVAFGRRMERRLTRYL
jgi:His/Glu/Gln/Arg/opine family amino acid ABC transporter permease subunit